MEWYDPLDHIFQCDVSVWIAGFPQCHCSNNYYSDVIISTVASQITRLTSVYSTVYSGADQRTHQSSATLGAVSIRKTVLPGMAIPMLKIRRPTDRLIFNMGIPIPAKTVFYIETGPWSLWGEFELGSNQSKCSFMPQSQYCLANAC